MGYFGLIMFTFLGGCALASSCRPIFRMTEQRWEGGEYFLIGAELVTITDVPDVAVHGLRNEFVSACPEGIWVGYQYQGFAGRARLVETRWGDDARPLKHGGVFFCYQATGEFQSIRLVGNPDNYYESALATFQGPDNGIFSVTYLNDTKQLSLTRFSSLVLTGGQEMEIFTGANYTGMSFCVGSNNGHISYKSEYDRVNDRRDGVNLFTNLRQLGNILNNTEFHSFRFGCSSNEKE